MIDFIIYVKVATTVVNRIMNTQDTNEIKQEAPQAAELKEFIICNRCQKFKENKDLSKFVMIRGGKSTTVIRNVCKTCYNQDRMARYEIAYAHKPRGIRILTPDELKDIKMMIGEGKTPIELCKAYKLSYSTALAWKKNVAIIDRELARRSKLTSTGV